MAQVKLLKINSGVLTRLAESTDSAKMFSIGLGVNSNTSESSISINNATGTPTTIGSGIVIYSSSGVFKVKQADGSIVGGFSPGGDLSGSATSQTVISISGASPIPITPATLQWITSTSSPTLKQADNTTNGATAQNLTIQSQNATGTTSTGGSITVNSGTGTTVAGNVNIQTGGVTRLSVTPTTTTFADTATAITITPVSAGTSSILFADTVNTVLIRSVLTSAANGASWTLLAQPTSLDGGSGGQMLVSAGAAVGTTGTGGTLALCAAVGPTTNGGVNFRLGTSPASTFLTYALTVTPGSASLPNGAFTGVFPNTITTVGWSQASTSVNDGYAMSITAQPTSKTSGVGGILNLTSGTASGTTSTGGALRFNTGSGTSQDGYFQFTSGSTSLFNIYNQVISPGTVLEFSPTTNIATGVAIRVAQSAVNTTAVPVQLNAQSTTAASSTGGNVNISAGFGALAAGEIRFRTERNIGGFVTNFTIKQVNNVSTSLEFANTIAPTIINASSAIHDGYEFTIQAQNGTGGFAGGNLLLKAGTGTTVDGYLSLQVGNSATASTARATNSKFFTEKGVRKKVTVVTGTYTALVTDENIIVTTNASPFTITLPASPTLGDFYLIKDGVGNVSTNNLTIAGNGKNIDGASTYVISSNYASISVIYNGTEWSVL